MTALNPCLLRGRKSVTHVFTTVASCTTKGLVRNAHWDRGSENSSAWCPGSQDSTSFSSGQLPARPTQEADPGLLT